MPTKIQKWGNSLAVRLPQEVVRKLTLKEGSEVVVQEEQQRIIVKQIFPRDKQIRKNAWKVLIVPTNKKKKNISDAIDEILYDKSY